MRLAPLNMTGVLLDFSTSEDAPTTGYGPSGSSSPFSPGTIISAAPTDGIDTGTNVPNWGICEIMYVFNSSTAIIPGTLVVVDKDFNIVVNPATSNTGRPVYVALTNFAAGSTTRQGGWVLVSGIAPVTFSVAATAGAVYRGTAGNATPTAAAGAQILNATTLIAAASAFTRQVTTQNGGTFLKMARVNGCFIGQTVSGTGIPASTEISAIDPGGNGVTLNNAMTATGTVTGTFTPTGYGIVHFQRAFIQGQIT
jgi:hypothetical protein